MRLNYPFRFTEASLPLALLVLCLVSFLPAINGLGFYWDDWPTIWFLHNWGAASFQQGFAIDRPLLAWLFMLTTSLVGESALGWQLFAVFTRWLACLALWWMLRGVWPRHTTPVAWAVMLFAVYPGFGQQYIAATYGNAFLIFALFLISLGSMVHAVASMHRPARFWPLMLLSVGASGLSMFMAEYFFGLELLRPALLWLALKDAQPGIRQRIRRIFSLWWPYILLMIAFVIWRAVLSETPRGEILIFDRLRSQPFGALLALLLTISQDFTEVNFTAWLRTFDLSGLADFDPGVIRIYAGIVVGCAVVCLVYLLRLAAGEEEGGEPGATHAKRASHLEDGSEKPGATHASGVLYRSASHLLWRPPLWAKEAVILGGYAGLVAGWPVWVTNLSLDLFFPNDRFTLMTMLGTVLLLAGLCGLIGGHKRLPGTLLMVVLVSLAAGAQYQQRLFYRQEWLAQKSFFWQLLWRAPALQPGTTLLTSEIPFTYYTDNSLTAPLNWIYAPENRSTEIPYLFYDIEARLGSGLNSLETGEPIQYPYRVASFSGSTSQAIVLFYDPPRCLKVIDPAVDRFLPVKPLYIKEATPLSRLDLILPGPAPQAPLADLWGAEPEHTWCYFFEKAELYRQLGEWPKVAEAADQAVRINKHFTQKNVSELLPFIEGYAHVGKWDKAVNLTLEAYQTWDKMQFILCDVWGLIETTTPPGKERQSAIEQVHSTLQCGVP